MRTVKPLLHTLVILGLIAINSAKADNYSQKTFLAPRPVGVNLSMEKSIWHEYAYQKLDLYDGHKIRSHFDITPFYQSSCEKHDTGEYFAIGKGNSFTVAPSTSVPASGDIAGQYLIRKYLNEADESTLAGKVSFDPKQEIWGVRFDYFQDVDHFCKNLFFRASMPVVYVRNDMGMNISDGATVTLGTKSFSLADFFAGNVEVTKDMDSANMQSPLTKSKINGSKSKVGLADIDLGLGYKAYFTKKAHLFLSLGITIPTEEKNNGEYMFMPVAGNGDHFGFGFRVDSGVKVWKNKHAVVHATFDMDYRYLFSATEHRVVMPKSYIVPGFMSQYYLAGYNEQSAQPLFPAANVLTQAVRVEPGSQLEAMLALSFKSSGFVIDLGYNIYFKDDEKAWIKNWEENSYGIALPTYDEDNYFSASSTINGGFLTKSDLDVDSCKTPSQITHKLFAGLGYQYNITKKLPAQVGLGGSYEFAQNNSALEQYALWLKLGLSF